MPHFPGVYVAATTPFTGDDHAVDIDAYAAHCRWLVDEGVDGLVPTGSLGEYESLTDDERRTVVETAIAAADGRVKVVPGVSAPSSTAARRWAEHAATAGADGVMLLPPTIHHATDDELTAHYAEVARVGLPIVAYNNPFSTKLDLTPERLARLSRIDEVVAVKEFSGDVRRVSAILDVAGGMEVMCGADDVALESALMGATGWIGGFTGVFPRATAALFTAGQAGDVAGARALYRELLPVLGWDTTPRFVQAIKLAQQLVGQPGGPTRAPRLPLDPAADAQVRADMDRAVTAVAAWEAAGAGATAAPATDADTDTGEAG